MKTDVQPVSELIHEAARICDPDGHDDVVRSLLVAFEDDDRPALGVEDFAGELRGTLHGVDPEGDSPAGVMTAAVAAFLATQPEQADRPEATLRHAAKLWFSEDHPPQQVAGWLTEQGVETY